MDIEEKRTKVKDLCSSTPCEKCPLYGEPWDHYLNNSPKGCLWIKEASEEELDRALKLFEDYYAKFSTVNTCVACGADIPEGRQVCPGCEAESDDSENCLNCAFSLKGTDEEPCLNCKNNTTFCDPRYESAPFNWKPAGNNEPDPIKPEYYNDTKITPFDVIDDWGLNFYLGNAVKYIKRAGKKAGNSRLQDLKKIREYIDHEIRAEEVN